MPRGRRESIQKAWRKPSEPGPAEKQPLTDDDLAMFARNHLVDEVRVLANLMSYLKKNQYGLDLEPHQSNHQALVESFALHLRNLCEFLFNEYDESPTWVDTACASDYVKGGPRSIPIPGTAEALTARDIWLAASREIEHLTYYRQVTGKYWHIVEGMIILFAMWDFVGRARTDPAALKKFSIEAADEVDGQIIRGLEAAGFGSMVEGLRRRR